MRLTLVAVCLLVLVHVANGGTDGKPPPMKCSKEQKCNKGVGCKPPYPICNTEGICCVQVTDGGDRDKPDGGDKDDDKPEMKCTAVPCTEATQRTDCKAPNSQCMKGKCCEKMATDGGDNDDILKTSCPAVDPDMMGNCAEMCQNCTEKEKCCSNGCGHVCKPDLMRCGNITTIFTEAMTSTAVICLPQLTKSVESTDFGDFCLNFWGGLKCLAEKMSGSYVSPCLKRMAMLLKINKKSVLGAIEAMGQKFNPDYAERILTCAESPMKETTKPPGDREGCGNSETIQKHIANCKMPSGEVYSDEFCQSFKSMVYCIARSVHKAATAAQDTHKMMQCASQINEYIEEHAKQLTTLAPKLKDFRPSRCMEKMNVCGKDDVKPLDKHDCSKRKCPTGYMCRDKYCCPQVNNGTCPERKGVPMCDPETRCRMDSDCKSKKEKCCNQGCGYMTCTGSESRKETACEKAFKDATRQLQMLGLCGDGKAVLKVPCCQNGRFCPIQGDIQNGDMYCVTEDGKKIPGSDFRGNKNCPRVHPGMCPAPGTVCEKAGLKPVVSSCHYDDDCKSGQKCCLAKETDSCVKKCVKATKAPAEPLRECPGNKKRSCCPVTLCQDRVCLADRTAVCRINPCGGCKAEFYDIHGKVVDCYEGISGCMKERAMAQYMNAFMRKGDIERIRSFISAHARQGGMGDTDGDDMNGGMSKRDSDGMDRDGEHDDDDGVDEYGERSKEYEKMEEDDDDSDESARDSDTLGAMAMESCKMFEKHSICKNGGTCKIGQGESWFELCECPKNYNGLFCENEGPVSPDTQCSRDKVRVNSIQKILTMLTMQGNVIRNLLTGFRLPYNLLPTFSCTASGQFNDVQAAVMVPISKKSVQIQYCVRSDTGMRIVNSPVMPASMGKLDCTQRTAVDFFKLPMKCRYGKMAACTDGSKCQYFYNKMSGKCESGAASHGFMTLTGCYDTCARLEKAKCPPVSGVGTCAEECGLQCNKGQLCCSNGCGHVCMDGVNTYPDLCGNKCDYKRQFCKVSTTGITQLGECADFPQHCLLEKKSGYGDKKIGAYFFDAEKRKCTKFMYNGKSGNRNRFYSLHQCQTECSTRAYKNPSVACPIPRALLAHSKDMMHVDRCDDDYDCSGDDVCCSNGMARVCSPPVSSCTSGLRCSLDGACIENNCTCPSCTNVPTSKVCGSDGMEYDNECLLRQHACKTFSGIRVVNCTDANTTNTKCTFPCTKEYMPVCGLVITETGQKTVKTFSNLCLLKGEAKCNKGKVYLLYKGECSTSCGAGICEPYQECVGDKCVCNDVCTEDYRPVCGHLLGAENSPSTFSNICQMRAQACKKSHLYVIKSFGPCMDIPEPEYMCPKSKRDIPFSAVFLCRLSDSAYCNKKTEKCCRYGAGTKCMSKRVLMRQSEEKNGVCPPLSYIDYKKERCIAAKCEEDRDCVGDAKCCPNTMCTGKTCIQPLVKADTPVCKQGFKPMLKMMCDPSVTDNSQCPGDSSVSYCASVKRDNLNFGLCCGKDGTSVNPEDVQKIKVCHLLKALGKPCQNGANCVGDLKTATLCICPAYSYGILCEKKLPSATCVSTVKCAKAPCDGASCPLYPAATCKDNYCEGCNALFSNVTASGQTEDVTSRCYDTHCWRKEMIMKMLKNTLMRNDIGKDDEPEDKDTDEGKSKDDDKAKDGSNDNDKDKNDMDDSIQKKIWEMAKMLDIYLPVDQTPMCTADGHFKRVQCMMSVKTMKKSCACVDQKSGMALPSTARNSNRLHLDCSASTTPNFPSFCRQVPDNGESCGVTSTTRYYFDHGIGECKKFEDQGCDTTSNNIFDDYQTCMSTCNAASYMPKICKDAKLKCAQGQECRVENGKPKCKDVRTADASGMHYEPRCNMDDQYEPRQCQGDVCVCVNPLNGTQIPEAIGDGSNLGCSKSRDSRHVNVTRPDEKDKKTCPNGKTPQFCKNGGNPCNECKKDSNGDNGNGMSNGDGEKSNNEGNPKSSQIDKDGVCRNCGACPQGQGLKKCKKTMCDTNSVCKQFPNAVCRINRCTCTEEYVALKNKVVNCKAVQSQCKRRQFETEQTRAAEKYSKANSEGQSQAQSQVPELKCSKNGGYEASCTGNTCRCLNATSGKAVGQAKSGVDINSIDCSQTQRQTQAVRIKVRLVISKDKLPSDFSYSGRENMAKETKQNIESGCSCIVIDYLFKAGSIIFEGTLEDKADTDDGVDLLSKWNNGVAAPVNNGSSTIVLEDGTVMTLSGAETLDILTAEDLEGGIPVDNGKEDKNKKTVIIVVVVVVAVVVLIACGVAFYCYKKANSSKAKDIPFDNLTGKDNPTYKA